MSIEMFLQVLGYFVSGAAVYAAIKSDLTRAIVTAEMAVKTADRAHERIDQIKA